jgi:hypothetical protein
MNADRVAVAFVALDDAGASVGADTSPRFRVVLAGGAPLRAE